MKMTRLGDLAKATAADVGTVGEIEEKIRELVHRESIFARSGSDSPTDARGGVNTFVERISAPALQKIEQAIAELESLRAELLGRKKHIQIEFRDYESAHEKASESLKSVESILAQWKQAAASETGLSPNAAE